MSLSTFKQQAALKSLDFVNNRSTLGLGTGSTVEFLIEPLAQRIRGGLDVRCVTTSKRTRDLALKADIPLFADDDIPELDLTIDGADEIDPDLNLIKGGGGALLYEKIVALASQKLVIIADSTKRVNRLGAFPLPVEIVPFGFEATIRLIKSVLNENGFHPDMQLRESAGGALFLTDCHHYIVDIFFGDIEDVELLDNLLKQITGVVEHGLFLGITYQCVLAGEDGIEIV